ncbi:MAG: translation initiation factor IF-2 subunit alpha [Candidatus Bathyarchaeia archaeon]
MSTQEYPESGDKEENSISTQEYPEFGDIVIATVTRISTYGAYVKLDEYNDKEALVHISEMATTWVRNIRNHAREGQKLVLKVLRVNTQKGQIDLSLRRVTGRDKTDKLLDWKKSKRADSIFGLAAEKIGSDSKKVDEIKDKIFAKYPNTFTALEVSVEKGEKTFKDLDIESEWASTLTEIARQKIKIDTAIVKGTIEVSSTNPAGVDDVRKALINAKKVEEPSGTQINVYSIGAPKYRVEITAKNYSIAEKTLEGAVEEAIKTIKSLGGTGHKIN